MDNERDDLLLPEEQVALINKKREQSLFGTIAYLKQQGALDSDIQQAREIAEGFNPDNIESFDDSLVYRAYYAAKKCKTASLLNLSKALGITPNLLKFYCEQYPKLGMAIQAGYMDAVDTMKESLVSKLYEAAMGTCVTNSSTTTKYIVDEAGNKIPVSVKEIEDNVVVTPNVTAQLELLKRLDPAWIPKVGVSVQAEINNNLHVTEDVNVQVDYKKLSVGALKELLAAGKVDMSSHTGTGASDLGELAQKKIKQMREENEKSGRGRPKKSNKPSKLTSMVNEYKEEVNNAKTTYKKSNNQEETKNGSKTGNRGRKKKDS